MKEQIDIKSIAATMPIFKAIDDEVASFYQLLKDKNIEPKSHEDVERVERFFNKSLKTILALMDKSSFEPDEKELMKARLVLDMHGNFAEKFNLNFINLPSLLGKWNQEMFTKAMENLQKFQ